MRNTESSQWLLLPTMADAKHCDENRERETNPESTVNAKPGDEYEADQERPDRAAEGLHCIEAAKGSTAIL